MPVVNHAMFAILT